MRNLLLVTGLCLSMAACGSTVQVDPAAQNPLATSQAPGGLGSLGEPTSVDTTTGLNGSDAAIDVAPGGVPDSVDGSETPLAPTELNDDVPDDGSGQTAGPDAPDGPTGSSVVDYTKPATGEPVDVGIMYIKDLVAVSGQFGGSSSSTKQQGEIDGQREYMNAAVEWMNAHGGLGGHKINLVYFGAEIAGTKSYEQNQSEMCATMTQDHDVVASVVSNITITNSMATCMQKAGALYVTDGGYLKSSTDWQQLSYTVSPTEVDSDRLGRNLAELTIAKGLAKSGDQIGLVVYDAAGYRAAERAFTKVAAASGIKTRPYFVTYAGSTPELSGSIAAVQSAVLAFNTAGVKTVVSLSSGGMMGYFLNTANDQRYYPRYVLTSNDGPSSAPAAEKNDQLDGALVLGTVPTQDVDLLQNPGLHSDPVFATCRTINKNLP
ncbi:MAG: ABC transporter substrate-binding protein, partial [Nocardioides sp.]